jgi:hypothetical protein
MRTSGTFAEVYEAAVKYYDGDDSDCPLNPVIRKEGDTWMLESGMNPSDCDIEVSLPDFEWWWFERNIDWMEVTPIDSEIDLFVAEHLKTNGDPNAF